MQKLPQFSRFENAAIEVSQRKLNWKIVGHKFSNRHLHNPHRNPTTYVFNSKFDFRQNIHQT